MNESSWSRYINGTIQHRRFYLILVLLICGFSGYHLSNIQVADDPLISMYPEGHPYLPAIRHTKAISGDSSMILGILEVKKGNIYNPSTIQKIYDIKKGLIAIDGIIPGSITSIIRWIDHPDTEQPVTQAECNALKRKMTLNTMDIGRYVSFDSTAVKITATLADMDQEIKQAYDQLSDKEKQTLKRAKQQQKKKYRAHLLSEIHNIKKKIEDDDHIFYFMGQETLKAQMAKMGKYHVSAATIVMLCISAVMLWIYFNTAQGVVIPLVSMLFSIFVCLGTYAWMGMTLNPLMLSYPLILGMLTIVWSVMVLKRYHRFCGKGNDMHDALSEAYQCFPAVKGVVMIGLVMGTLSIASVPMIRDLGVMGVLWGIATFVSVTIVIPILISFFPIPGLDMSELSRIPKRPAMRKTRSIRRYLFWGVPTIIGMAVLCVVFIQVGGNMPGASYFRQDHPWNLCFNKLAEKFISPFEYTVYVQAKEKGGIVDPEVINAIGDFSRYLLDKTDAEKSISIDMMVRKTRAGMMDGNPKWQVIPGDKDQIAALVGRSLSLGLAQGLIDQSRSQAMISTFFPESDTRHINRYASRMQKYIGEHTMDKATFFIGGGLLGITKALNDGTRISWRRVVAVTLIVTLISAVIVTGRLFSGVALTLALIVAQVGLYFVMWIFQIPVSQASVPAFAATIGYGVMSGCVMMKRREKVGEGTVRSVFLVTTLSFFAAACVFPWWFVGMTFQSTMMIVFSLGVVLHGICAVFFISLVQK